MKAYDPQHIRNVALLGHSGSGKTTLAETMLFEAGILNRRGSVEDGNTASDYHPVEQDRGSSVFTTPLFVEWRDHKINILDAPGYDDFVGEVIAALRVADTALVVLSAPDGVQVGTELIWEYLEREQKPTIFVVNKVDHEKSNFDQTIQQAKERFGRAVTVVQYPVNEGKDFDAIIDVLKMVMYKFPPEGGKPEKLPIPDSERERADQLHNELVEAVAENDETLMELYFEKGELDEEEMRKGLKLALLQRQIFPVFCVSAVKNMGSGRILGFINNVAPSPVDVPPVETVEGEKVAYDPELPTSLFVFKVLSEPHVGDLCYFKVHSGKVLVGQDLLNHRSQNTERLTRIYAVNGKNRIEMSNLQAGDIGATVKLKDTHVNDTLHDPSVSYAFPPLVFPEPKVRVGVEPVDQKDEEKIAAALHQLHEEDPTLIVEYSPELKQSILKGQGDLHLNIAKWRLENRFGVKVNFVPAKIPYRETIQSVVKGHYKHKKQTGGAGQYGEVYMILEPYEEGMPPTPNVTLRATEDIDLPWGGKLIFQNCIVGGVIDQRFMPAILKGIMEIMQHGPLIGAPVRDVRVSVYDGSMHPVDSNEISFKIAAMMAFKQAFLSDTPRILEPIYEVEVIAPSEFVGDIMGDLPARRALIMGADTEGHYQVIKARMPLAELDKYATALRSMTQGRATFRARFAEYVPVPHDLQEKLITEHQQEKEAAA